MKTFHVMKTLSKGLFAFLFAFSLLVLNPIAGQAAEELQFEVADNGDYIVQLPDGSQEVIPVGLAGQINQALALGDDGQLSAAIQNIVGTNASTNNNLAAAITGLATALAPNRGGAIITGGLRGAPNAGEQVLNAAQGVRGVNLGQVIAAINSDPQIPPAVKQQSTGKLTGGIQPAGGSNTPPPPPPSVPGSETAENPSQTGSSTQL